MRKTASPHPAALESRGDLMGLSGLLWSCGPSRAEHAGRKARRGSRLNHLLSVCVRPDSVGQACVGDAVRSRCVRGTIVSRWPGRGFRQARPSGERSRPRLIILRMVPLRLPCHRPTDCASLRRSKASYGLQFASPSSVGDRAIAAALSSQPRRASFKSPNSRPSTAQA